MPRPRKYNWEKLKAEFLAGEWKSVLEFLDEKKIPRSNSINTTGWVKDKRAIQEKALEESTKKLVKDDVEDAIKVRKRQARLARFMQMKGANVLKEMPIETTEEARKLVVAGMQEERSALGMNKGKQSLTQINIGAKTNLDKLVDKLDYEGLLELIAELKRERAGRPVRQAASGGKPEIEEGEII